MLEIVPAESVPFTLRVNVPLAEREVLTSNRVVPEAVTVVGVKDAVAPIGSPLTLNFTVPV